jgi:hypothetical protein
MQIVNFPNQQYNQIGASGDCPHCSTKNAYFRPVTASYTEPRGNVVVACCGAQCEVCKNFVVVVGFRNANTLPAQPYNLQAVYPLGKPDDNVEPGIPQPIAEDFQEALRCRWVKAFKATVVMCRRAIQASCLEKKANPKLKLIGQIDEIAKAGLITEPLRQFAHEVRLEGNDGAHPDPDGLANVIEKDADDIIEFTREYLNHVYVMPEKLAKRKPPPQAAPAIP